MIHGYVRVSTEDQGREDRSSLEDQERRIRAVATIAGDEEPIVWRDIGVSGAVPVSERPSGGQMVRSVERGDAIVAAKLDRLFRSAQDALNLSKEWRERGIELILIDMGVEPVTTSASGRLYFTILSAFAEFERDRIAERISSGKRAKRERGGFAGGHAPIGFQVRGLGRSAELEPNEREVAMIAHARSRTRALNNSPTQIARELNALGYRSRAGTLIAPAQVFRWLRGGQI